MEGGKSERLVTLLHSLPNAPNISGWPRFPYGSHRSDSAPWRNDLSPLFFGWLNRNVSCKTGPSSPASSSPRSCLRRLQQVPKLRDPCPVGSGRNLVGSGAAVMLESLVVFTFLKKEG